MLPAAVGFQCPSCVKEGAKQTRTGRLPYGGERSANPALTSQVLIGINVVVWALILLYPQLVDWLALHPVGICEVSAGSGRYYPGLGEAGCALNNGHWIPGVSDGAPWQIVTSVFAHEAVWHIGFNMLALYFLGPQLESILGRARFLALYLLSGLTGSAAVMLLAGEQTSTLGASGAVYGLMGALLIVAMKIGADVRSILGWIGINIAFTFLNSGSISWQGHLGGLIGGVVVAAILVYAPKENRTTYQVLGMTAVGLVSLGLIVARSLALG